MDLVLDHVMEFEDVHIADGDRLLERFPRAAVEKFHLAVLAIPRAFKFRTDLLFRDAQERWSDRLIAVRMRRETEVKFEDLAQVHAGRHTERGQDDVDRSTVFHVRHFFDGEYLRDDTLVAVAACKLVTDRDIAELGDLYIDAFDDATFQVVALLAREYLDADDAPAFAVFHAERCVLHVTRLLTEDRA